MARLFYRLLLWLLVPALVVRLLWRARRQPEYLHHLSERFGRYTTPPQRPVLWIHAVSVGETRAAEPLIKSLVARHPGHQLLISCMTPTGRATAEALYRELATIVYLPYDFAFAQRRFLRHWRPALGVLMETELWPNLLFEAKAASVPLALINARLSTRSARGYARFAALARPALGALSAVAAQTTADAERLSAVGAPVPVVCGNLKFEVTPSETLLQLGREWRRQVTAEGGSRFIWLAASTREGEEAIILDALKVLAERHPATLLVLVPRHPQRFGEVAALASDRGLRLQRRSEAQATGDTQVWLGDSMGEMAAYYAMADCCLIGGSLLPWGSQNLIEACACGCPVLIGPSDFNFRQAASDAIEHGAAQRIDPEPPAIAAALVKLIEHPALLEQGRAAALQFTAAHRGATERTQAVLDGLLNRANPENRLN
jgi:3-deoxy-D-manno-octulosonic-acid transferase